jgi:hypothetical protein
MKRPRKNDANYCRLKGWGPDMVLTIVVDTGYAGRDYEQTIRITAVGEEAILVRRVYQRDRGEGPEIRWVRTLVNREVRSALVPS